MSDRSGWTRFRLDRSTAGPFDGLRAGKPAVAHGVRPGFPKEHGRARPAPPQAGRPWHTASAKEHGRARPAPPQAGRLWHTASAQGSPKSTAGPFDGLRAGKPAVAHGVRPGFSKEHGRTLRRAQGRQAGRGTRRPPRVLQRARPDPASPRLRRGKQDRPRPRRAGRGTRRPPRVLQRARPDKTGRGTRGVRPGFSKEHGRTRPAVAHGVRQRARPDPSTGSGQASRPWHTASAQGSPKSTAGPRAAAHAPRPEAMRRRRSM